MPGAADARGLVWRVVRIGMRAKEKRDSDVAQLMHLRSIAQ